MSAGGAAVLTQLLPSQAMMSPMLGPARPRFNIVQVPKVENDVTCFTVDTGNAANYFPVGPVPYE